jgi:hypothetical protein
VVRLELGGHDAQARLAFNVRAPVNELLPQGTIIEGAHLIYGPHLRPLDPEAEAAQREFELQHPDATLDPSSALPLSGPWDEDVLAQLETMAAEAASRPAAPLASSVTDAKIEALTEQVSKLVAALSAIAVPAPPASNSRRA